MPPKESKPRATKATAGGKEKKTRTKKDPDAPKRGLSAYMFMSQDWRERIKSANPDASFGEVGRLLGAHWQKMSDAEKKPYIDMAERDKVRAATEKAAYDAKGGSSSAGAKKSSKKAAAEEEEEEEESE